MYNYIELDESNLEFVPVAAAEEVINGDRIFVDIDEYHLVVFNIGGNYYAIGDVCSHDGGPLGDGEVVDHEVVCPRHGARFDIRNGEVTALPAIEDIPAYPVRVQDGQIEVGIPLE